MTRPTEDEIEAAANRLEQLLDEFDPATAVVIRIPPRRCRPAHRGGYPAGSKPAVGLLPPPAAITRPAPAPDDQVAPDKPHATARPRQPR